MNNLINKYKDYLIAFDFFNDKLYFNFGSSLVGKFFLHNLSKNLGVSCFVPTEIYIVDYNYKDKVLAYCSSVSNKNCYMINSLSCCCIRKTSYHIGSIKIALEILKIIELYCTLNEVKIK